MTRDRAALDAIEIMEIVQDAFPDVTQSERSYGLTMSRLTRFLRDRDSMIEADLVRQFRDN